MSDTNFSVSQPTSVGTTSINNSNERWMHV